MNKDEMKVKMARTIDYALRAEKEHGHRFGRDGVTFDDVNADHRLRPAPSLSSAGQYYLACTRLYCGRAIFDDGTGSATDRQCGS